MGRSGFVSPSDSLDIMIVLKLFSKRRTKAAFQAFVSDGDRARDRRDWAGALASYRSALAVKPDYGISIQAGHCLKELKSYDDAFAIYAEAEAAKPEDDDLQLQIGHLEKVRGNHSAALARYRNALGLNIGNGFAKHEIVEMEQHLTMPPDLSVADDNVAAGGEVALENQHQHEIASRGESRANGEGPVVWIDLAAGGSFQISTGSREFRKRYEETLSSLRKFR